jgi:hypothetical protein
MDSILRACRLGSGYLVKLIKLLILGMKQIILGMKPIILDTPNWKSYESIAKDWIFPFAVKSIGE